MRGPGRGGLCLGCRLQDGADGESGSPAVGEGLRQQSQALAADVVEEGCLVVPTVGDGVPWWEARAKTRANC